MGRRDGLWGARGACIFLQAVGDPVTSVSLTKPGTFRTCQSPTYRRVASDTGCQGGRGAARHAIELMDLDQQYYDEQLAERKAVMAQAQRNREEEAGRAEAAVAPSASRTARARRRVATCCINAASQSCSSAPKRPGRRPPRACRARACSLSENPRRGSLTGSATNTTKEIARVKKSAAVQDPSAVLVH